MTAPGLVQRPDIIQDILERLSITEQLQFRLVPEVLPVMVVADSKEEAITDKVAGGSGTVAAVAAQFGRFRLNNPLSSVSDIFVQAAWGATEAGALEEVRIFMEEEEALGQLQSVEVYLDTRVAPRLVVNSPIGLLSRDTAAAQTGLFVEAQLAAIDRTIVFQSARHMVLAPGFSCTITTDIVNTVLVAGFVWRERLR